MCTVEVKRGAISQADSWIVPDLPDDLTQLVRQDLVRLVPLGTRAGSSDEPNATSVLSMNVVMRGGPAVPPGRQPYRFGQCLVNRPGDSGDSSS